MKILKCEKHKNTFMITNELLVVVLPALLTSPEIIISKIERCENGGWHVFWNAEGYRVKLK